MRTTELDGAGAKPPPVTSFRSTQFRLPLAPAQLRKRSAEAARRLAQLSFALAIVLFPLRYRFVLLARPSPPLYKDYTDFLLFPADIFMLATLGLWTASLLLERRRVTAGPLFLTLPLAGLTAVALLSTIGSVDPALALNHAIRFFFLGGVYLYALNEIQGIRLILIPVGIQAFLQGVVGVAQAVAQHSVGLAALGELELDPAWNGVSIVWGEGVRSLRAYGLSDHPNILGGCLAFSILLLAGGYQYLWPAVKLLAAGILTLDCLALFLTFSRSAWLALLAGALLLTTFLWSANEKQSAGALVGLFCLAGIVLLPFIWIKAPYLGVRLNQGDSFTAVETEERSLVERARLNQVAAQLYAAHPLLGVGIGTFPVALRQAFPDYSATYQPAHIVLLDSAAETGTLGGLFYLALLLAPWFALWLSAGLLGDRHDLMVLSTLLLALTIVGFLDYYTWLLDAGRSWQWLAWGMWGAAYQASMKVGYA